ncbi:hypothetical protein [Oleiagrimonas soli]|uniref:Small-conductance mechanosensitive channel n=1 Tax=Oleiagrimonas soli TaxID=1543381 RepID=A0A841KEX5_9GAMM|nr:hypothetical protein [Oleiagrimonas soli]MBB6183535.1 small-conductance mechanosensitive channel [Oleiagrimonas soli]
MKKDSRWWEYYVVRYFVGTIFGAGILVVLNSYQDNILHSVLQGDNTPLSSLTGYGLVMYLGLGLAFCYIASAPLFCFHALRGLLDVRGKVTWASLAVFLISVVSILIMRFAFGMTIFDWRTLSLLGVVVVVSIQISMLGEAFWKKLDPVVNFYGKLAVTRSNSKPATQEYVESYRHLREHGNAFGIMLFELILGLSIASVANIYSVALILLAWIAPAVFVWLVATVLEIRMV